MSYMRIALWLGSLVYFLEENVYFGWHAFPQSDAELIADGIVFLLTAIAIGAKP